ncbi:beta-lactamase family protein [Sphingomonas ginsenosidivorax]|uniref:Beta-lactamase family protein n=1 Tax=Sphingomonas ginsenosidivorax TaxID=862135 RepID=A0A5C6UG19_9SPHN|nr:serine hydrolase domain-containing protein [Sphingomonas ginsenosidivorax]TXC71733.1 beta-lactamase family protein [Sphingomonas ginsenosidivorax]
MTRTHWITGGIAALAATAAFGQAQRAAVQAPDSGVATTTAALLPNTQGLFAGYVRDDKMPGIVGAFGFGDRPTLFPAAGRIAEGGPVATPDSLWRVYSMTKPITGMAAMMLVEDGRLKLDDPVSKYIPAFKTMTVATNPETSLEGRPARNAITIRMLLTHTAGLGYSINAKGALLKAYEQLGVLPFTVNAQTEMQMRRARPTSLAAFADRVATLPLIAEPGAKWSYSMGLDVMGRVIEVASGMSFERFLQTRMFAPLKMNSTYWSVPRSEVGRLATNYAFVGANRTPLDPAATSAFLTPPSFAYGGAGLVMSARDYDRFLHMLQEGGTLDGVRVMKPETVALGMSNLLPAGVSFGGIGNGNGGTTRSAGMGFGAGGSVVLADMPGGASKGTYGWGGAAGTIGWVDPVRHRRGTVMVNYFPGERWPVRQETIAALAKDAARFAR